MEKNANESMQIPFCFALSLKGLNIPSMIFVLVAFSIRANVFSVKLNKIKARNWKRIPLFVFVINFNLNALLKKYPLYNYLYTQLSLKYKVPF